MWYPLVVHALVVGSCLAGFVIEELKGNQSDYFVEAVVKTVKSCYGKRVNAVRVAGSTNGILIRSLFGQSIPVTSISNTRRESGDGHVHRKSLRQLQVCVVAASTPTNLAEVLFEIQDSFWWNHLAPFIILAWPSGSEQECAIAYEMLLEAWKVNLLNAKFMCLHRAKGPMIYGFNPFTETAPQPWELKKTYRGKNHYPWTLFARRFQEDGRICEELDFDKTKDLGGYTVHSGVILDPGYWSIDVKKTDVHRFGGAFGEVARILCSALNATCILLLHDNSSYGLALNDVFNRRSDILLTPRNQLTTVNLTTTYPHWESGPSVVTQYSGYVSQLSKLNSVIDSTSRWGVYLVFFITLLFFKYCLRQALIPAILNNLRLACNGSILMVPQNQAPRFYLASLFLFVLTIQAVYQGKLASLLTKQVPLPNVDTMQDLVNSHHMIYGYKTYASFFPEPIFRGRFVALDGDDDNDYFGPVLRNSSACCVKDWYYMITAAEKYNLYMSSDRITDDYWIYQIRQDWPLEQRVNIIIQRMVETNLIDYWYLKQVQTTIDRTQFNAKLKDNGKAKIITLENLSFAFAILGIGLGVATAVFIIEFGVSLIRPRFTRFKISSYIRNVRGVRKK